MVTKCFYELMSVLVLKINKKNYFVKKCHVYMYMYILLMYHNQVHCNSLLIKETISMCSEPH